MLLSWAWRFCSVRCTRSLRGMARRWSRRISWEARGTARHAIFLGGVVTLTHTLGVFALGLITLSATRYIVPERLYPVLSALSGGAIVCIGAALLRQRIGALMAQKRDAKRDGIALYDEDESAFMPPPLPENAPISLRSLVTLGITGGALPCPSALVVMLSATALHRVAFGLALITTFSLGLAVVLTGIGLLVVRARGFPVAPADARRVGRAPADW